MDQIISFLAKAKYADDFFKYRVSYDTDGNISGILLQTRKIIQHFKYGLLHVIMVDMMKHQINSANWPYCGPVMMTCDNVVVCACKAIFISENLANYSLIMNSI